MTTVLVYPDAQGLADAAGARLGLLLADAVSTKGRADAVLTGGTSGTAMLASLAASPLSQIIDWTSVHVWWGDERFVPTGDEDRNEGQAQRALLAGIPLPEENIHRVPSLSDVATAEEAAAAYAAQIAAAGSPAWDVVLLGMGPDGHVASLFPGHPVFTGEHDGTEAAAVHDSPKPPADRVTLTLSSINRAQRVWLLAAGESKAEAVADAMRTGSPLPAAAVCGVRETLWLIDAAASTRI